MKFTIDNYRTIWKTNKQTKNVKHRIRIIFLLLFKKKKNENETTFYENHPLSVEFKLNRKTLIS